ncbi:MAG: rod shape-determining protein MreC [Pseudomonadota bacterium]|jgi:rod shape-determining protein MreC|nr:rod shape-determining protein MreC [Pseudomonadota bacterium]
MRFFKIWLILLSIGLILIDKYSFISTIRDSTVVFVQKHTSLFLYRLGSYPQLLFLQTSQQQELATQNAQLKKQVAQYSVLLQQSKSQTQDLKSVNRLNPNGIYDDFTQVVAKAILDVNFFVNNQLLIDAGSSKSIVMGAAVVNESGVIGQISNVNAANSQVALITNPDFKIYLQQSVTKSKMLAQGAGNDTLIVRYIDKNDKIQVGDILQTTGLDDVYPANVPVARVTKVFYENNGFNSALCVPVVDFRQLQYVVVLKK